VQVSPQYTKKKIKDMLMSKKYTRRCSSSLMIREKQINSTIKFHSYTLRDHTITGIGEDVE
jgi:hypothetical protein